MAMGLANGSSGYPFMALPMYRYLCGEEITSICVSDTDVPNFEVRELLQKVYYVVTIKAHHFA